MTQAAELPNLGSILDPRLETFTRVMTTKAPIAQTPKELVWTLNKAKLYRYIPVLPPEARHPVPLLLVFALMNRPSILDLRPGHSFVEYMVGPRVRCLSAGLGSSRPGRQRSEIRRLYARLHAASDPQDEDNFQLLRIQFAGLVYRRDSHHDLCGASTR